ncbi:type II toxin-antitoxin system RelE family toxin [Desulfurobacterium thermolithotrophum]|uniref:type II toxin-antitoxin system RelE family toxin n=1 Tax=Desulfurobacterium thermolithotrophum TaxID=64160 RepID=UPI00195321DF|nr:type II toxin-antitoxin system RelE/ParE family toxin [Desulfurobacterium thermolithotrophum]
MNYKVLYHHKIPEDLREISSETKKRIKSAIENKLMTFPEKYGIPLRKNLKGFWKLRVGDYRIVFKINRAEKEIYILAILHRRKVYEIAKKRI